MLKKWFEMIFDHRISLRERMFRAGTAICMVAAVFVLPMGRNIINILILTISLIFMALVVKISIQKDCVEKGATCVAVLILLLFPFSFFTAGGFYSGVPEWLVIYFIYISITLTGKRRVVFYLLCVAETEICYYLALHFPEFVAQNTQSRSFFDSANSVILVGILVSGMLIFLNRLYEEENEISRQQKKEIEELNKAENHFFSSMSHEIRTPMNAIIGLNEIILRGDIPEDVA